MIRRLILSFLLFIYIYAFYQTTPILNETAFEIGSMAIYITTTIIFLKTFRKRNFIFCPETFFLMFGFVIAFFDVLVLNNIAYYSSFYLTFLESDAYRSLCLSMVAELVFILGCDFAETSSVKKVHLMQPQTFLRIPSIILKLLNVLITLIVIYYAVSDLYVLLMKYNTSVLSENANMLTLIPTVLMMVASFFEFIRLLNVLNDDKSLWNVFKKIDKLFLFNFLVISSFLFLTGNRNDMLLVFMPPVILYYFLIKKISNKMIIIFILTGFASMVLIGLTRGNDNKGLKDMDTMSVFRDFGAAYVNQQGLIRYTDTHGTYGYSEGISTLISSVPFLGGLVLNSKTITSGRTGNTNDLTTEQWQLRNVDSGLGTSLLGDLYYAGGVFFVLLYMFLLGWFLSYSNFRLINGFNLNIVLFFSYCWIFSDIVYLQRATYYSFFRYIGFSLIVYFILSIAFGKKYFKL